MEIKVEKQIIEMIQKLTEKVDRLGGRFDKLEGKVDGQDERFDKFGGRFDQLEDRLDHLEGRQIEILTELRDFRSETSQNFATLIDSDRKVRSELQANSDKYDSEIGHLNLKTDSLQSEILKMKRQ
jgi:chromosome segregation ATPase